MIQNFETVPCPICKSTQATKVRSSGDIVQCSDCNLVYLRTRPTVEELEKSYQNYASTPGSHMRLPDSIHEIRTTGLRRNQIMSDILAFTGDNRGRFLDVGSGWGAFLLNAREHGFLVNGVEICKEMADFATNMLGIYTRGIQLEQCDFSNESMRVVSLIHSLEHLPNPATALGFIHRILEPGGIICGIVPNFDSWASNNHKEKWKWLDPEVHYTQFSPDTLRKTLWQFGFEVCKLYTSAGDYDLKLLPSRPTLDKIETELHGEEIKFFARKL